MRLTLNEEPTGDEIQARAVEMFGMEYAVLAMWPESQSDHNRCLDMECLAEQTLIRERIAAKQHEFA